MGSGSRPSGWVWLALVLLGMLLFVLLLGVGVGIWLGVERGYFGGPTESADGASGTPVESSAGSSPTEPVESPKPAPPAQNPAADSPALDSPLEGNTDDAQEAQSNASDGIDLDDETPSVASGSFFGVRADGRRFVYVVDCSGSMIGEPFTRARAELLSSLANLAASQEFFVILFSTSEYPMLYPEVTDDYLKATDNELKRVKAWLGGFVVNGGTNPAPALLQALGMKPDAVFFLSDGAIPTTTRDAVKTANGSRIPIHTIGFIDRAGEAALKSIADDNDGQYKFVP